MLVLEYMQSHNDMTFMKRYKKISNNKNIELYHIYIRYTLNDCIIPKCKMFGEMK